MDLTSDQKFMKRALRLARKGMGHVSPNPLVGAVVVRDGTVIGEGYHRAYGEAHAEVEALTRAGDRARGAVLYVTLEPCCHFGKTPPCTGSVMAAGIREVVCAMEDPFPQVCGKGIRMLREAGITVRCGVMEKEARELNEGFIHRVTTGRPFVTLKTATTLDGKIATGQGESQWITCEASRRQVHRLRFEVDAVMTGIETVLMDDPMLTPRMGAPEKRRHVRVILDSRGRVPLDARIILTAREFPVILAIQAPGHGWEGLGKRADLLRKAGVEILEVSGERGKLNLREILAALGSRGIGSLLVEAGGTLAGSLVREGLINRWVAFISPRVSGDETSIPVIRGLSWKKVGGELPFHIVRVQKSGEDVKLILEPGP